MRLDKFLKLSRIIKRRTIAKEAASSGKITINEKIAKPGDNLKIGDIINIQFGENEKAFEVLDLNEHPRKEEAKEMYKEI